MLGGLDIALPIKGQFDGGRGISAFNVARDGTDGMRLFVHHESTILGAERASVIKKEITA